MSNGAETFYPTPADLEQIVAWAMEINDKLGEFRNERRKTRFIREVFDGADVVFAVWQNPTDPGLFTCKIVKGLGREGELNVTAFLVPNEHSADLMLNLRGDGVSAITHEAPWRLM
jgi:hypothetical protein